jgi:hypothetical protein
MSPHPYKMRPGKAVSYFILQNAYNLILRNTHNFYLEATAKFKVTFQEIFFSVLKTPGSQVMAGISIDLDTPEEPALCQGLKNTK